ncbi:hypothetical protein TTHERM_00181020 (macronuclear) [Tetrahymena thermophila SB210]|uniref:Uncharacterized protein n=1 Tax=Tetrahymena thermophila (strain SB210) TaxID=312017 RepID=Q22TB4_TETTS|nr:hypothetical protein TTHERM_00181020 [Tetrahymena thermophila SB210]EAR88524.1 hypothetical protein TTHERM_00181020 [Tetrahymena thermophila SB210]|eukprot:XP_001008769.1 hypothetical protein TTHERM_00181020 [Tetrahymena thermophila SB210]
MEDAIFSQQKRNEVASLISTSSQISKICDVSQQLEQFSQLGNDKIEEEFKKCNKSNFIKNILNQFINFLINHGDDVIIESLMAAEKDRDIIQIRKEFQNFIRGKKPNATMLVSILKSKRFSPHFHYFLNYYSIDWIKSKQLKDRKNHLLCINYLIRCKNQHELIDRIIKYKKKL